jgi:hypothetical protein
MKSKLPHLSALALLAVTAAVIAPVPLARGQNARIPLPAAESAAPRADGVAPYWANDTPEPEIADESLDNLPPGQRLLVQAMRQLQRHESVYARLQHKVSVEGNQYVGNGSYWQQGRDDLLQVYLQLQFAGLEASQLQVANDRYLWVDRRLPTGRAVTRFNLRALRAEQRAETAHQDSERMEIGAETHPEDVRLEAISYDDSLLFSAQNGGLPGLVASLLDHFDFMPPQAMRLTVAPPLVAEPKELPVFAVVGHWKPEKLAALTGVNDQEPTVEGQEAATIDALPERFPQEVLLLIGQTDLFPYRIEYRRLETPAAAGAGAPQVVYQLSAEPLVVLELTDVTFDLPVAAGQFDYSPPPNVDWTDQTATLIARLRKERQVRFARSVGGVSDADSEREIK